MKVTRAVGALRVAAAVLAGMAAWGGAHAEPVTYVVDPQHTKVYWEVSHFGTSTHRGRFDRTQGHIVIDREAGSGEAFIRIAAASVSSGVSALDSVLRGAQFLSAEEHPEAWFVAQRFRFEGAQVAELRGEFTLRGVSRPLALRSERFACRNDPALHREVCGGDFEGEILRSEFGITFGLPFVGDKVRLLVAVEAVRQ